MDVSSVTAVAAAPAQSAATPATIDAVFGALLQSMAEAESAALAAPAIQPVQSAALALVLPASAPTGQEVNGQQDNAAVEPGSQTPWLFAPITQTTTPDPLPGFPTSAGQQNTDPNQNVAAIQQPTAVPIQPGTTADDTADDNEAPLPTVAITPAPAPAASVQPPAPQEATPAASQPMTPPPQSGLQSATELPPATPVPEPIQTPVQAAQQTVLPQAASPQADSSQNPPPAPSSALDVADQIVTPAPRDPAPVKPAAPKDKVATDAQPTEPQKRNDPTNAIVDVLAGFLLPQIEPTVIPANDATADTVDPVAPTKSDDAPVIAATDQNAAAPVQPMPVAMVQPPPAPVSAPVPTDDKIAPIAVGQAAAPKNNAPADETATPPVAQKPATRQPSSHAPERSASQPIFVPANDTAPDSKPEPAIDPRPAPNADTRTASAPDTPPPANAPNPPPHQAPAAIANPAIQPVTPSGLRKLTAGLQVAVQEQETTSSIDKLGLTIATKSIDGLRHFDIRLDPPELGRVQVQLTTDDTGRSQANVVVDKPQTLELLQRDAQNLNRALNEAGLDVSNNGLNFSLREQYRQNDGGVDQGRSRSLSAQAVVQTDATQIHSSLGSYAPNSVRLDIRV